MPEEISCTRCGDTDGPHKPLDDGQYLCEGCIGGTK